MLSKKMRLGETVEFTGGSYEIRAIVDGRYIVKIFNIRRNIEVYEVWTAEERENFDLKKERCRRREAHQRDLSERNQQIFERNLAGEALASLGREFGISPSRVRSICSRREREERGHPHRSA